MPGTSTVDPARNYKISTHVSNRVPCFCAACSKWTATTGTSQSVASSYFMLAMHSSRCNHEQSVVSDHWSRSVAPFKKGNRQQQQDQRSAGQPCVNLPASACIKRWSSVAERSAGGLSAALCCSCCMLIPAPMRLVPVDRSGGGPATQQGREGDARFQLQSDSDSSTVTVAQSGPAGQVGGVATLAYPCRQRPCDAGTNVTPAAARHIPYMIYALVGRHHQAF